MCTYNILSIDGGGLRGIVPVRILQKIESITQKKIQDTFDMMAGTSTGGLLVSCMTLRDSKGQPKYSLDDIGSIYINKGDIIFPIRSGIGKFFHRFSNLFSPAYSASGLEKVLKEYVTEQRIKEALRPILVSTYDLNSNKPVFFKSSEANDNEEANARIYDICRATSAAPTYLPAYTFQYKGNRLTGIDGGVYVNNPTMAAIAEISKYGNRGYYKKKDGTDVKYSDIRVLSLGTGSYNGTITEKEAVGWGELQWVTQITNIMMRGVNQTTDYESGEMLDPGSYLRLSINIPEEKYSDMADARKETLDYLEKQVSEQVTDNTDKLAALKQFLANLSDEKDYTGLQAALVTN
ncbi:MAG TPA: patatin-like phospholipase family protein [Ohtaekwangia sp.]|uniref:patatin-like phospholipase family protein n=1 Tax=Ohtaekwangia sp. TaxID=2066019 RepID=UPI002F928B33